MLSQEVTEPLKDIGKSNPLLRLTLAMLIIAVVTLFSFLYRANNKSDKKCEAENDRLRGDNNQLREEARKTQYVRDSAMEAENRQLRQEVKINAVRIPSQDSAIKSINKLIK